MATASKFPPQDPEVAVVTVSYGSESVLGAFLSSLPTASSKPLHIVVADNKPAPEDASVVAQLTESAGGRYLAMPTNEGYGHAVNAAVSTLPSSIAWVLISNPDVVVSEHAIDQLLESAGADQTVAAIGPRILSSTGEVYPSARMVPSVRSGIGHAIFANLWPSNPWTRQYRKSTSLSMVRRDAGWLSGAFLLVRRSVFDDLRGFDASYFMYFEDVDLGYRIGKMGLRNVYEPAASVVHTGAHSTKSDSARMVRAHHDSARRFLFQKYSGFWLWPVRVVLGAGLAVRSRAEERRASRES